MINVNALVAGAIARAASCGGVARNAQRLDRDSEQIRNAPRGILQALERQFTFTAGTLPELMLRLAAVAAR